MKKLFSFFIVAAVSFAAYSCSKDSSIVDPSSIRKSPLDMTWTADTLTPKQTDYFQNMMENMVVFSPNDVWLCGWSDADGRVASVWHYDGKSWKTSDVAHEALMLPNDIVGNSGRDIWVGGNTNYMASYEYCSFAHYDGIKWTRSSAPEAKGMIIDMTKDAQGNFWACTKDGVVFKYQNGKWMADTVVISHLPEHNYWLTEIEAYKGKIFIHAIVGKVSYGNYWITGDFDSWAVKDSFKIIKPTDIIQWGDQSLYSGTTGELYSTGLGGIWKYSDNKWVLMREVRSTIYTIAGISPDYLIAVGDFKQVLFYNGSQWINFHDKLAKSTDRFIFKCAWTDGKEAFIVGYDVINGQYKTVVWHGK